jgi:hypothetical protein
MRRLAPLLSNPAAFRRSTDMIPSILGGMMLPYRGQLTTVGNILDVSSGSHVALFASGFSPRGQSNRFSGGRGLFHQNLHSYGTRNMLGHTTLLDGSI